MTHPTLTTPESRSAVRALWEVNPDGTAELMLAFPEAVFSWLHPSTEVETAAYAKPARVAGMEPSTKDRGQVKLW